MEMPGGSGARAAGAGAGFAPRSSADWRVEPSCSAADLELVAAFATNFPAAAIATGGVTAEDSAAALRQVRPYRARTPLGAHGRVWDVHCWALPAAANADAAPVALCMHGHGHSCCVTSWAALFAPLHAAGFNVLAVDAPCFGRSGGSACESGQANLWRADDAALVLRLLASFGVSPDSQRVTAFAQCMGGAMFLRALHAAPGFFAPFHVLSNTTIGSFPGDIADILRQKGGSLLAYHELDPDHMREAVAYKALTQLSVVEPKLCRFIDNERARAASDPHLLDCDHFRISLPSARGRAQQLSRDGDGACFFFQPSEHVMQKIMRHVTRVAVPPLGAAAVAFNAVVESAVSKGEAHVNLLSVAVRVRPPMGREAAQRRSYAVRPMALPGGKAVGAMGDEITVRTAAGGRVLDKPFLFHRVFAEEEGNAEVYEGAARPLLEFVLSGGSKKSVPRSATLFAYGQTGSGKTHTVSGDGGVVPRLVDEIYARCGSGRISMSYVQVYNDELTELLGGDGSAGRRVGLRDMPCRSNGAVELAGVVTRRPGSAVEMLELLAEAGRYRATSSTQMNATSSRSHALLTLQVEGAGVLHVVDLAGSERIKRSGAAGERFSEATAINGSLLALGRVVNALTDEGEDGNGARHVPYRESTLTRLLASALGGNSRTGLVACVSPAEDSAEETHNTLRFAARATFVKNEVEGGEPEPEPELSAADEEALDGTAAALAFDDPFGQSQSCVIPGPGGSRSGIEVYGDFGAGPARPVIICLHYYGHGSRGGWQFVEWFPALRAAGYRVLAPSFPGHGATPGPAPSAKPDADALAGAPAAFVTAVLDHFGVKKCVVLGHDWGGGVAFEYAARLPHRVSAVVGHSISYRGAESSLATLRARYSKKRMMLCWVESEVHLKKKGLALAKAAGVKLRNVHDGEEVLGHVVKFLGALRG